VLWSSWIGYRQTSTLAIVRQAVFAHIPGGGLSRPGTEPLFAWVRLSVADECPPLPQPETIGFAIRINAPFMSDDMRKRYNVQFHPERSKYPRRLYAEQTAYDAARGFYRFEEGGRCAWQWRLGRRAGSTSSPGADRTGYDDRGAHERQEGNALGCADSVFRQRRFRCRAELALGYDGALAEANRFWSQVPETAATFDVPETNVTQAIRRSLQTQEILGERDPSTDITRWSRAAGFTDTGSGRPRFPWPGTCCSTRWVTIRCLRSTSRCSRKSKARSLRRRVLQAALGLSQFAEDLNHDRLADRPRCDFAHARQPRSPDRGPQLHRGVDAEY